VLEECGFADAAGHDGTLDARGVEGANDALELADLDPGDGVDLIRQLRKGFAFVRHRHDLDALGPRRARKDEREATVTAMSPTRCMI